MKPVKYALVTTAFLVLSGCSSSSTVDCADQDGDGYGAGEGCLGLDCRDDNPDCHAGACCDDTPDCIDNDLDGYGIGPECSGLDCNDDNPACHAGFCCPSDCVDNDGDGYGTGPECLGTDCDDSQAGVHPGASEVCNQLDDDCDGLTDEDGVCPDCIDGDGDGYGAYCENGPDCDDGDAACWTGACCQPYDALLEIYLLDIWAQPLPAGEAGFVITREGSPVNHWGHPVVSVPLRDPGSYYVALSAPEHQDLYFSVDWDGTAAPGGASLVPGPGAYGQGLSFSHDTRDIGGAATTVHTVYAGLRHNWFSAQGRPARRGNDIQLMINGEEAWASVYAALTAASQAVNIGSWWWMSDFELIRPWSTHAYLTPAERWANTIMGVLEDSPAHVRVLIGEFWGSHDILDFLTTDDILKSFAETPGDGFEFMGVGNETYGEFQWLLSPFFFGERVRQYHSETVGRTFEPEEDVHSTIPPYWADLTDWPFVDVEFQLASWHQKFMVIDHQVAFIGGMNVKSTDWDSQQHLVFDHRRMDYAASVSEREEVMAKELATDLGPRRDYMLRVEGPAAQDAADVFQRRWRQAMDDGAAYAQNCTDFTVQRDIAARPANRQVQVTATMPQPFWEHAIAETWFNAVAQAERYIFIEDQYWRIPLLVDAIAERMRAVPDLKLLVITKPIDEWLDPGCEWTYRTHQQLLGEFGPGRYRTCQLITFDSVVTWGWDETESRYVNIDTHSKMFIVDDKFMSVGSCNKNNRGIIYEGELNAAVLDPDWVREQRRRIFANLLPAGTPPTDDVATWWQQFSDAAAYNDAVYQRWEDEGWDIDNGDGSGPLPAEYTPHGFVHSLALRTVDDCFFEGVGPDMTAWRPPATRKLEPSVSERFHRTR